MVLQDSRKPTTTTCTVQGTGIAALSSKSKLLIHKGASPSLQMCGASASAIYMLN